MRILAILTLVLLAACAAEPPKIAASPEAAKTPTYRAPGGPQLTLLTTLNNRSNAGAHTALVISGSQRVLFDPAGSFSHAEIQRQADVIHGLTDRRLQLFRSYQASSKFRVVAQTIPVSAASAEKALKLAQGQGHVSPAYCTNSTSSILKQLPEFADVDVTFYPDRLMTQLAGKPGVRSSLYYETDDGQIFNSPEAFAAATQ